MARVKLFGAFAEMAGWSDRLIEAATLSEVMSSIAKESPALGERLGQGSTLVILNQILAPMARRSEEMALSSSDELAFGPPVSGG